MLGLPINQLTISRALHPTVITMPIYICIYTHT